jgi:CRP/FNR family transcriptional regulator, cyclic AMP receptor protein
MIDTLQEIQTAHPAETLHEIIHFHSFFEGLGVAQLDALAEHATLALYGMNQPIFQAGSKADHFYLVRQGNVALETAVPHKNIVTIENVGSGEALGWSWLFPPYQWHLSARSADRTQLIVFDAAFLRHYCGRHSQFGYKLLFRIGQLMMRRLEATHLQLAEFYGAIKM